MMKSLGMGGDDGGERAGGQMSQEEYEASKPDELRKDIRMISGCQDCQTSADVSNVSSFQLPDPAGELLLLNTYYITFTYLHYLYLITNT